MSDQNERPYRETLRSKMLTVAILKKGDMFQSIKDPRLAYFV